MILQKWRSLGVRFLAVIFLVAFVPMVVFLVFTVPRTQKSLADSLSGSLKTKAVVAALGIDRFLQERVVEARVLSQADVLETADVAARIQYLTEVVEATPWIADIDIVGVDGVTICSSGDQNERGLLAGDVLPGIGSVIRAASKGRQGEVFVSEAIWIDSGTGLCFVTPITDDANIKVVSLLAIEVSLRAIEPLLRDFLQHLKAHGAKTVYLVDNEGRIVVGAGSSVATFETLPDLATQPDLLGKFENQGTVGSTIYTDADGVEVVAGYADLGEFGENEALDWSIIATVSLDEWSSGFTRTANQSIVFLLVSSLIAVGIGAMMSWSVVRRIGMLGKATTIVGQGDLTAAVVLKGDDELSHLSRDFNEMVTRLRELEHDRKQAEDEIRASLEEKEILLREVHHRVKNNLQVISSLLSLQSKSISNREAQTILETSQDRVQSMAFIHEKLYQSPDFASIDFEDYLKSLTSNLYHSYAGIHDGITLRVDAKDVSIDINTAMTCGLIVNELVSNSLKYAFPNGRKGEVCIEIRTEKDDTCIMSIGDNGIGLPTGLDINNSKSLGLRLVNMFAKQLKGAFEVHRNGGTEFKITFLPVKSKTSL